MAYCDYLFRRSNGIFYFRYVFKPPSEKPREIRISLSTRNYGLAKKLAASYFVALMPLIDRYKTKMNADETLIKVKCEMLKGIDPNNPDHLSRFENNFSDLEKKVLWVREHLPDKFEGQSIQSILDIYKEFAPIFNQVKDESNKQNKEKLIDEIREKAKDFYGLESILKQDGPKSKINISGLKISEVAELYCDEMMSGGNWREKTLHENMVSYKLFCELQGDMFLTDVNKKNISDFKGQLRKVPKNFNKLPASKGKSLSALIQEGHGLTNISVSSVNKHLSKISTLLNWAKENGHCVDNPAFGISIKQKKNAQEDRLPFTRGELSQIFSTKIYSKKNFRHTYYFWLPLLGLYSGGRINELCQLDVSDIRESEGIFYIDINEDGDKTLKNLAAYRKIPIHSKLIEIGFLNFVDSVRQRGSKKVFPSIKKGRDGYGTAPSKWFGRLKDKFNLEEPEKKVFHSFRHNFADAMKSANIPEPIAEQLIGHKTESITYGLYGSGSELNQLKTFIEKIRYEIQEIESIEY